MRAVIVVALLLCWATGDASAQDQFGIPSMEGGQLRVLVSEADGVYTYVFVVDNQDGSLLVRQVGVDLSSDESREVVSTEGLDNSGMGPGAAFTLAELGPSGLVGVAAPELPPGHEMSIDPKGRLLFGAPVEIGATGTPITLTSRALPGIRTGELIPDVWDFLPTIGPGVDEDQVIAEKRAAKQAVQVAAPLPALTSADPVALLAEISVSLAQARDLSWVATDQARDSLQGTIDQISSALGSSDIDQARSSAQDFIDEVISVSCTELSCPGDPPLNAEAHAVLRYRMEFLLNQLGGPPEPPSEACGEIGEEDFGQFEGVACTVQQGSGTVVVFNQAELDAYLTDFGFDGSKVKNLNVKFNPVGEIEIRSPCHVNVAGENGTLDVTGDSLRVFGRTGVTIAEDASKPDVGITVGGGITLVSTQDDAGFSQGLALGAQAICVQALKTAKIGIGSTAAADSIEIISTGDLTSSDALIRQGTSVAADSVRLEASREAALGNNTEINANSVTVTSTGDKVASLATIKQAATVSSASLSLTSGNKAKVGPDTVVTVTGNFEMEAQSPAKCTVSASASITAGSTSGNCAPSLP